MSPALLDAAVMAHMHHAAMGGADPLVDALYQQLEAPAAEGATAPVDYAQGLPADTLAALADAATDPWQRWVWPVGVAFAIACSYLQPWGWAA